MEHGSSEHGALGAFGSVQQPKRTHKKKEHGSSASQAPLPTIIYSLRVWGRSRSKSLLLAALKKGSCLSVSTVFSCDVFALFSSIPPFPPRPLSLYLYLSLPPFDLLSLSLSLSLSLPATHPRLSHPHGLGRWAISIGIFLHGL